MLINLKFQVRGNVTPTKIIKLHIFLTLIRIIIKITTSVPKELLQLHTYFGILTVESLQFVEKRTRFRRNISSVPKYVTFP